jgi:hypothetical protein
LGFDPLLAPTRRAGRIAGKIDQAGAWTLDRTVEIAMDALRCPPGDAEVARQ